MDTVLQVKCIDDILEVLRLSIEDEDFSIDNISISDNFNVVIKLHGEQWDGKINYRIGNFIVNFQNDVIRIYNSFSDQNINITSLQKSKKGLVVSITVNEGCTEIVSKLADLFRDMKDVFKDMESKHKTAAICTLILSFSGVFSLQSYYSAETEKALIIADQEKRKDFLALSHKSLEIVDNSNERMAYVAKVMQPYDTLTTNGVVYSQQEARDTFIKPAKETKNDEITHYIDDEYMVVAVYFEEGKVKLLKGKQTFYADTRLLTDEDKSVLYEEYKNADVEQRIPSFDLQVSVGIQKGKIKMAAIVGIGPKREKSVLLDAALAPLENKHQAGPQMQSLFDIPSK